MRSPESKTLSFLFLSVPGTKSPDSWAVRVTLPPGSTADTPLEISAVDGGKSPIGKATFEFMGARIKISKGSGTITLGDFVKGIHETGVWMMRPRHQPVPGALTFG